jgi:hypothetical protein
MKTLTTALLLAVTLTGCRPWAWTAEHKLSINAPARVSSKGTFYFTVSALDNDGQPASFAYQWTIQWVGVEGSKHKGKSGVTEKISVKGGAGKALLKIYGYDPHDNWTEIANHAFDVE